MAPAQGPGLKAKIGFAVLYRLQGDRRFSRHPRGGGMTVKKKGPLERLAQGARESSGDLLSRIRGPGTIGDLRLDFRVRDGNGYDPHSITAETKSCMENKLLKQPQNDEAAWIRAAHADS